MVLVPREPTEAMAYAGARSLIDGQESRPGSSWAEEAARAYRAMLAAAPQPNHQGILNSSQPAAQPVIDHAEASGGIEGGPQEDRIEAAYWRFDARRKGYEQWKKAPMSERDAFKAELRNALEAEKVRAEMRLVARGWQPAAQPEPMARFCPGCGSVGPVPEKYRDCCPDGDKARMIPEALARHCRDLFQLALSAPGDALHPQQPAAQPASAEPVAEVTGEWHSKHIAWLPGSPDLPLGAKLYTLPRDPAEVMRLAEDAQRWRFWRQHWQLLTRMEVARPAGIDLSRRGVYSPDEMDEVTDAALARAVGAAE